MKITKLILKGYNRFLLSNIETLEYTPSNTIQIIASRNSSGKSSLLSQLNPLPPNDKDFRADGYKHIEILHNNINYTLISANNKHSFLKNNEELNTGHTKKVQLDLVQNEFNINPKIMDIVYVVNNFSDMGPEERKKWLTLMSNVDYTYSIGVYLNIKRKHRDLVGAIKLLQDEIVRDELTLKEQINVDIFKDRKEEVINLIDSLSLLYDHNIKEYQDVSINLDNIITKYLSIYNNINNKYTSKELKELKYNIEIELKLKEQELDNLQKSLNNINILEALGNKEELVELVKINKKQNIKSYSNISTIFPNIVDKQILSIHNDYAKFSNTMLYYIQTLEDEYSIARFKKEEEIFKTFKEYEALEQEILYTNKQKDNLSGKLEQLIVLSKTNNVVICPRCSNSWDLNHNDKEINIITKELEQYTTNLEKLLKVKQELEVKVTNYKNYINILTPYKLFLNSYPNLEFLINYILDNKPITQFDYSNIINRLNTISILQEDIKNYLFTQELITKYESNIKILEEVEQNRRNDLQVEKKNIETKIHSILDYTNILKRNIDNLLLEINANITLSNLTHTLSLFLKNKRSFLNYKYKEYFNKQILESIQKLKTELASLELAINDHILLAKRVEDGKTKLEEYKKREKYLAILEDTLSPSTGLIAKSINSFIFRVVDDMNKFINAIWSYRLELQPCSISETSDLDYKFSVRIDEHIIIDDIKRLSSSGKEIVDLAFRVVFTKYMKINYLPLYLDELGASFDKEHHNRVYSYITNILSTKYDQIYAISHYENIYGSFKNADFIILDNNNINLSESLVNQDVLKISRY